MTRIAINLGMTIGFLVGVLIAWTGFRLLAFEHDRTSTGVAAVLVALAWWWGLTKAAHTLHRRDADRRWS